MSLLYRGVHATTKTDTRGNSSHTLVNHTESRKGSERRWIAPKLESGLSLRLGSGKRPLAGGHANFSGLHSSVGVFEPGRSHHAVSRLKVYGAGRHHRV